MFCDLKVTFYRLTLFHVLGVKVTKHIHCPDITRVVTDNRFVFGDSGAKFALYDILLGVSHGLCLVENHLEQLSERVATYIFNGGNA